MNFFGDYCPGYEEDYYEEDYYEEDEDIIPTSPSYNPINPNRYQRYRTLGDCMDIHAIKICLVNVFGDTTKQYYINLPWSYSFWFELRMAFRYWLRGFKPYNPSDELDNEF